MPSNTKSVSHSTSHARPVHEIRFGRIRAAIWENELEHGFVHRVSVNKSYKSGDEWKETSSFMRDDLPVVAKILDLCHTWIYEHGNSGTRQDR